MLKVSGPCQARTTTIIDYWVDPWRAEYPLTYYEGPTHQQQAAQVLGAK